MIPTLRQLDADIQALKRRVNRGLTATGAPDLSGGGGASGTLPAHAHAGIGQGGSSLYPAIFGFTTGPELTIAAGEITVTGTSHTIDTESDAASDEVDTINGLVADTLYRFHPANGARTVVFKHGTGNILVMGNADLTLDDVHDQALGYSPDGVSIYIFGGGGGGGGDVATDAIWDALGDTVYGTGANTGAKLAGNITTTKKFLRQTGDGAASAAPAWDTIADGDVPSSHAGSTHAATQAAAEATAAADLASHEGDSDPHTGYRLESVDLFVSKMFPFTSVADALATGALIPEVLPIAISGEHGTLSFKSARVACVTAGTGTNTILIEVDDNPGFTSATVIATLNLGTGTSAADVTEDNSWAPTTNVYMRARCTAVGGTAPQKVTVTVIAKERAENY